MLKVGLKIGILDGVVWILEICFIFLGFCFFIGILVLYFIFGLNVDKGVVIKNGILKVFVKIVRLYVLILFVVLLFFVI